MIVKDYCEISILDYCDVYAGIGQVKFEILMSQDSYPVVRNTNLDSRKEAEISDINLRMPVIELVADENTQNFCT